MDLIIAALAAAFVVSGIDYWIDLKFYRVIIAFVASGLSSWAVTSGELSVVQYVAWAAAGGFVAIAVILLIQVFSSRPVVTQGGRR